MRTMVDTIHADVRKLPRHLSIVAGYDTGSPDIRWTPEDWAYFTGQKVRIDQSTAIHPLSGDVKDIEPFASNIAEAVQWAKNRRTIGLRSTFYVFEAELEKVIAAVVAAGLSDAVFYWVANWNLTRAEAEARVKGQIVGVQYASPTSNPTTKIPGTRLTLSQVNADLSVIADHWFPTPTHRSLHKPVFKKPSPLHPKVKGSTLGTAIGLAITTILTRYHVHVDATLAGAIAGVSTLLAGYLTPVRGSGKLP